MSEIEFIDLFSEEPKAETSSEFDTNPFYSRNITEVQEEKPHSRMKLNDYKHQAHYLNKEHSSDLSSSQAQMKPKRENPNNGVSLDMSDDKLVWAGAIFVFFGVFVFIFGYWMGNMTVSNIKQEHRQYEVRIKKELEQKKLENESLVAGNLRRESDEEEEREKVQPALTAIPAPAVSEKPLPIEQVIQPRKTLVEKKQPVAVSKPSLPPKTIKKKTSVIASKPKPVLSGGTYTIQVSAYTQIEKARALEDILRNKGLQAYIVETMVNGNRYFRVRVGKFNGKSNALAALKKLKSNRIARDSYLIKLK